MACCVDARLRRARHARQRPRDRALDGRATRSARSAWSPPTGTCAAPRCELDATAARRHAGAARRGAHRALAVRSCSSNTTSCWRAWIARRYPGLSADARAAQPAVLRRLLRRHGVLRAGLGADGAGLAPRRIAAVPRRLVALPSHLRARAARHHGASRPARARKARRSTPSSTRASSRRSTCPRCSTTRCRSARRSCYASRSGAGRRKAYGSVTVDRDRRRQGAARDARRGAHASSAPGGRW